jgi:hypothetical protein
MSVSGVSKAAFHQMLLEFAIELGSIAIGLPCSSL